MRVANYITSQCDADYTHFIQQEYNRTYNTCVEDSCMNLHRYVYGAEAHIFVPRPTVLVYFYFINNMYHSLVTADKLTYSANDQFSGHHWLVAEKPHPWMAFSGSAVKEVPTLLYPKEVPCCWKPAACCSWGSSENQQQTAFDPETADCTSCTRGGGEFIVLRNARNALEHS